MERKKMLSKVMLKQRWLKKNKQTKKIVNIWVHLCFFLFCYQGEIHRQVQLEEYKLYTQGVHVENCTAKASRQTAYPAE